MLKIQKSELGLIGCREVSPLVQNGNYIAPSIYQCEKGSVKLAIDAPKELKIVRTELIYNDKLQSYLP